MPLLAIVHDDNTPAALMIAQRQRLHQIVNIQSGECISAVTGGVTAVCTMGGAPGQNFMVEEPYYMHGMPVIKDSFRIKQANSGHPGICLQAPAGCAAAAAAVFGPCNTVLANFYTSDQGSTMVATGCNVFPMAAIAAAATAGGAVTVANPATGDGTESFYFQEVYQNKWGGGGGNW